MTLSTITNQRREDDGLLHCVVRWVALFSASGFLELSPTTSDLLAITAGYYVSFNFYSFYVQHFVKHFLRCRHSLLSITYCYLVVVPPI